MDKSNNGDLQDRKMDAGGYPGNSSGQGGSSGPGGTKTGSGGGHHVFLTIVIIFLVIFMLYTLFFPSGASQAATEISYSQFIDLVEGGFVSDAVLSNDQVEVVIGKDADISGAQGILYPDGLPQGAQAPKGGDAYVATLIEDEHLLDRFTQHDVNFSKIYTSSDSNPFLTFLTWVIVPTLFLYLIYYLIMRWAMNKMGSAAQGSGGGIFGIGKSKAKEYDMQKETGVKFSDVAGEDEAKEALTDMVDFLHHPGKYQEIGAKQPRGALLVGPPGTGKTLLAKAVAGEARVPFFSITGSEFVEMFVGMGASRVRDLFEEAKSKAPCIIFIDEIDAIGKSRDNELGSNDEREQTLNQLLAEMDGFDSSKGIIVLAATNRPEVLDKALLRPGRFDRRIIVDKPDLAGREAILKVHGKDVKLAPDVDFHEVALATSGATGADLANMINEGALLAVKEGRKSVSQKDLMDSVEVVIAGKEKKDRVMNKTERRTVAFHEVGHALVSALQKHSMPVTKITIVPRTMGSLGYTMNVPEEERYLLTKDELLAQIATLLGGRGSEIVKFGQVSTGAANDIEKATKLARQMVTQYGMSEDFGPMELESNQSQYMDGRPVPMVSQESETKIDEEVRSILAECQKTAIGLLKDNRKSLDKIAATLLEKENITGEEFMKLLREDVPGLPEEKPDETPTT